MTLTMDAPKCKIDVNVILPTDHPLAENVDSQGFSCIFVFQSIVGGGFSKSLKLEQDATLELDRFEQSVHPKDVLSEKSPADQQEIGPTAKLSQNGHSRKCFSAFCFCRCSGDHAASGPTLFRMLAVPVSSIPSCECTLCYQHGQACPIHILQDQLFESIAVICVLGPDMKEGVGPESLAGSDTCSLHLSCLRLYSWGGC